MDAVVKNPVEAYSESLIYFFFFFLLLFLL
jgi:hypothetical protein